MHTATITTAATANVALTTITNAKGSKLKISENFYGYSELNQSTLCECKFFKNGAPAIFKEWYRVLC